MVTPVGVGRVAAGAGQRRRAVAGPAVPRLGGHPRRHHRGVAAGARRPDVHRLGRGTLRRVRRRRGRHPGGRPVRAAPSQLPAARPAGGDARTRARPTGSRGCCSASSPPTARSTRCSPGRVEICRDHGGEREARRRRQHRRVHSGPAGRGGHVARLVPARAVRARRAGPARAGRRDVRDRVHLGPASTSCTPRCRAAVTAAGARAASPWSRAASPTCTRTARRRTSRSSRPAGAAPNWRIGTTIKAAVSEAIVANGGTITHHHAVGRDHRHWYDRQRPDLFADALRAAKCALDPRGILNPGVLID